MLTLTPRHTAGPAWSPPFRLGRGSRRDPGGAISCPCITASPVLVPSDLLLPPLQTRVVKRKHFASLKITKAQ